MQLPNGFSGSPILLVQQQEAFVIGLHLENQ